MADYKDYGQRRDVTRIKKDLVILIKEIKTQRTHLVQDGTKRTSKLRPSRNNIDYVKGC